MPTQEKPNAFGRNNRLENEHFSSHLKRLAETTTVIDDKAPRIDCRNFLKISRLKDDYDAYSKILKENFDLLRQINETLRKHGRTENFNQTVKMATPMRRIDDISARITHLEEENFSFGKRLLCAGSKIESIRPLTKDQTKKRKKFVLPQSIICKYGRLSLPKDNEIQRLLFRPEIYFKLEIKGVRPLGKIIITLFTEACPQVVLEFVKLCTTKGRKKIEFRRLFSGLWMEGEIKLASKSQIMIKKIEYDKRVVDHSRRAGILSFSEKYLSGFRYGILNFAISFRSLNVLNGRRVGFGVVTGGMKLLDSISEFGTKLGKPIKDIIVTECGIVR